MNTPSIILTVALCIIQLVTKKQYLLFTVIMAACFVPMNQRIAIFGLEFTTLRFLVLTGIIGLIIKGESRIIQWNKFDRMILAWTLIGSLIYCIQQESLSSFINKCGVMFDVLGMYWLSRQVLINWSDVVRAVQIFSVFAIITAPLIALEHSGGSGVFSLFGPTAAEFHRGRFRAAGSFPHPIVMGCFWALLLPLFYAMLKVQKGDKLLYSVALFAALSNVFFSASSTPIMTIIATVFFWMLYQYRMRGQLILIGACLGLFLLHLVMKAPVWHLLARINIFGGSTGWHRFFTFDTFIKTTSDWFLLGTKSVEAWNMGGQIDITNQFVLEGVRGGMITLLLFIVIIYHAIKIPGKLSLCNVPTDVKWMSWGICVMASGHFATFWGVSYFGQINILLMITFALVSFTFEQNNAINPAPPLFQ